MTNPAPYPQGRPPGPSAALAQTLLGTLTAQRELYVQLAALAQKQSQCVAAGEAEELMTVLAARARLIDQLAPLDRQLQPYKDRWQEVLAGMDEHNRQNVSVLLTQVQQLLSDILAQDQADQQILVQQKTDIGAQLGRVVHGAQLTKAYGLKPRTP